MFVSYQALAIWCMSGNMAVFTVSQLLCGRDCGVPCYQPGLCRCEHGRETFAASAPFQVLCGRGVLRRRSRVTSIGSDSDRLITNEFKRRSSHTTYSSL